MDTWRIDNGFVRGALEGRAYVGPVAKGSAGDAMYHRVLGALVSTGTLQAMFSGDGAAHMLARAKLFGSADGHALVKETLRGYSVDGIALDTSWDDAFAGRPWEPVAATLLIWEAQGFLLLPGVTPSAQAAALERKRGA